MTDDQNNIIYDEKASGMDPELKRYFLKIVSTVSYSVAFLMFVAMAGIYYGLAFVQGGLSAGNIIFYALLLLTFFFLLRYYVRLWRG